jgi:hypothetical protein
MSLAGPVGAYWGDLLTVGLLGTDRRDVPDPPAGPLADLAADHPQPSPSTRVLQQVAACTAARRAGLLPGPAVRVHGDPAHDGRPITPSPASATWRRIVDDWPVLEDEWLLTVIAGGWRLAPELVPAVLARHRTDRVRRARAMAAAGTLGRWLVERQPHLGGSSFTAADAEDAGDVPPLPITPAWQHLLLAAPGDIAVALDRHAATDGFAAADRAVLVNFVARVRPDALTAVAEALRGVLERPVARPETAAIAVASADLAELRRKMLSELEPSW